MPADRVVWKRDGVEVEVTGDFFDLAKKALGDAERQVLETFEQEASAIKAAAAPLTPVRKGRMAKGYEVVTRITSGSIETILRNTAPHAYYVRFSKYTRAEHEAPGVTVSYTHLTLPTILRV